MDNENQQVNQTPVTSPSTPQSLSQSPKSKLPLILGCILILLLVGGGAYYLGTKKSSEQTLTINKPSPASNQQINVITPSISPASVDMTDWKTYTDSKQMYSIKYPSDWHIFPNVIGGIVPGYDGTVINSASKLEPHGETLAENGQAGIAINIAGIDKSESESIIDYVKKKFSSPDTKNPSYSTVEMNGNSGLKYIRSANEPDSGQPIYYISNKNKVYTVNVSVQNPQYENIVNQILQSFTFIN